MGVPALAGLIRLLAATSDAPWCFSRSPRVVLRPACPSASTVASRSRLLPSISCHAVSLFRPALWIAKPGGLCYLCEQAKPLLVGPTSPRSRYAVKAQLGSAYTCYRSRPLAPIWAGLLGCSATLPVLTIASSGSPILVEGRSSGRLESERWPCRESEPRRFSEACYWGRLSVLGLDELRPLGWDEQSDERVRESHLASLVRIDKGKAPTVAPSWVEPADSMVGAGARPVTARVRDGAAPGGSASSAGMGSVTPSRR
ncbi:unnamed protein product [Dovyalis caffra]|uniref:Uncharacterized protein n=1 Tax=Dovyalis caffra TaxID=77055 RepID=A0AAV1QTI5_9ROSI|nr:unnamed protein product [Dovyalis caffra]